jgi:hypothetical protein|tara:strand:+ start:7240 stop:7410 length:171 start_codon:yes stop_codon:yes gene_type:complete
MNELEQKAFEMAINGVEYEDIENQLGYEFIFFRTPLDNKLQHATMWKPKCKNCFNI